MKCLYFIAPTIDSSETISNDLHEIGVNDWFIHIISKDEAQLKKRKLHSGNWLETLDFMRTGFIGANVGFIIGVIGVGILMVTEAFGPNVPMLAYIALVAFTTLFGAWEGGPDWGRPGKPEVGALSHDEIEAGKFLILIYARKGTAEDIKSMMRERHPESRHVATDRHFISPFSVVRRKRNVAG